MINVDFSDTKTNKSDKEIEFDNLAEEYFKQFGVYFGYNIAGYMPKTIDDAIKEVRECIKSGKKQVLEPQNAPGVVY